MDAVRAAGADCQSPKVAPGYYGSDANTTDQVLDIECDGAASRIDMTWFKSAEAQTANNALVCELSAGHLHGTPDSMVILGSNWRVGNAMVDGQCEDLTDALAFTGQPDAKSLAAASVAKR